MIHGVDRTAYDMAGDPRGEVFWRQLLIDLAKAQPFTIRPPDHMDCEGVVSVAEQIVEQFRFLIEDRRFSEELYYQGQPRPEKAAQMLFFAVAYSYCKANNLDITPEAETGTGPVDFKVASGFNGRVLVEIKLSTNKKLVPGYTRQLGAYQKAEETVRGYYTVSPIIFIDGKRQLSASKR